jgi:LysM repeat protein
VERLTVRAALRAAVPLLFVAGVACPQAARSEDYVIQPGDTLSGISDRFGIAVTELVRLNTIKDIDVIIPGTGLRIGSGSTTTAASEYRVRSGDTLSEIADRHDVSVASLMQFNDIGDEDIIRTGATLRIPRAGGATDTASSGSRSTQQAAQQHRVQPGESVSTIADRYGVSTSAVIDANGLSNAHLVRIGQVLTIPRRTLGTPSPAIGSALDRAAAEFGVDPYLVRAVSLMESGWRMEVVSHAGAVGLMQLMPETARWAIDILVPGATNWRISAVDNARMGTAVLSHLLELENGNVRNALAAYYQGWTALQRDGMYKETVGYVDDVLELRRQLRNQ